LPPGFAEMAGRLAQLERVTAAQADRLDEQDKLLGSQAEQLQAQNTMIVEQNETIVDQQRELLSLQAEQQIVNRSLGDTRRRQQDQDRLVERMATAVANPTQSAQRCANAPPRFNVNDKGASKILVPWLAGQRLYLSYAGHDLKNDRSLIELTMLNMNPQTMQQAQNILRSLRPDGAPDDWIPSYSVFCNALIRRWGGNPAQDANESLARLRQTGTVEAYVTTFTRLVEEAASDALFAIEEPEQVRLFLKGLDDGIGQAVVTSLGGLQGRSYSEIVQASIQMAQAFRIVRSLPTTKEPSSENHSQKRKLKITPGASPSGTKPYSAFTRQGKKPRMPEGAKPPRPRPKGIVINEGGSSRGQPPPEDVTCYRCGHKGHKANVCPQKGKGPERDPKGKGKGKDF
jgi:hypothetical protein